MACLPDSLQTRDSGSELYWDSGHIKVLPKSCRHKDWSSAIPGSNLEGRKLPGHKSVSLDVGWMVFFSLWSGGPESCFWIHFWCSDKNGLHVYISTGEDRDPSRSQNTLKASRQQTANIIMGAPPTACAKDIAARWLCRFSSIPHPVLASDELSVPQRPGPLKAPWCRFQGSWYNWIWNRTIEEGRQWTYHNKKDSEPYFGIPYAMGTGASRDLTGSNGVKKMGHDTMRFSYFLRR